MNKKNEVPENGVRIPFFKKEPDTQNGKINIGAGENPLDDYYNIDLNPRIPGVYKGDATHLPNVKTGSQSRINIDNPYGYDPFNPEIMRILSKNGQIKIVGNYGGNKWFREAIEKSDSLGLVITQKNKIKPKGYKTSSGQDLNPNVDLTEYILQLKHK